MHGLKSVLEKKVKIVYLCLKISKDTVPRIFSTLWTW